MLDGNQQNEVEQGINVYFCFQIQKAIVQLQDRERLSLAPVFVTKSLIWTNSRMWWLKKNEYSCVFTQL